MCIRLKMKVFVANENLITKRDFQERICSSFYIIDSFYCNSSCIIESEFF